MFFHRCRLATIPYGCSLVMKTLRFTTLPGDGIGPRSWRSPSKSSTPLARSMAFARKARPTTSEESESTTTGKPCLPPPCPPANKPTPILFGSVGGPKWENLPPKQQPERAALLPAPRLSSSLPIYARATSIPNWPTCPLSPTNRGQRNRRSLRSRTYRRSLFRPTQANRDPR